MSETKLKTVGDCVNLCKSAGIEISHLDDNLFETAGAIDGLLCKIAQLEKEKYESIDAWNSQLEKASVRVKELEQENAELKNRIYYAERFEKMLADMPEAYEVFDTEQSLAEHDKQVKIDAINDLMSYLDSSGFKSVQRAVLKRYIEQLMDQ